MPQTAPVTTPVPTLVPEFDPERDRPMDPERICPQQKTKITREIAPLIP